MCKIIDYKTVNISQFLNITYCCSPIPKYLQEYNQTYSHANSYCEYNTKLRFVFSLYSSTVLVQLKYTVLIHLNCVNALINLYLHLSTTYPVVFCADLFACLPRVEIKILCCTERSVQWLSFAYFNIHNQRTYDTIW